MSEESGREQDTRRHHRDRSNRRLVETWQKQLREDLRHRKNWRAMQEEHEQILGRKVRQLRLERGWTQEQLAEKLNAVGWPMHQTTVAKLEAGTRPLRVAEADALALAFGLPIEALWYLPVRSEPWGLARMRERLKELDETQRMLEDSLRIAIISYADHQWERMRLVEAINETAAAAERGELDMGLTEEKSREFVEAMDDRERLWDWEAVARLIEQEDPERASAYRAGHDLMRRLESDEPSKVASEAWRRYVAGESPDEIGRFIADSMPPGTLDPLHSALQIIHDVLGPSGPRAQGHPGKGR